MAPKEAKGDGKKAKGPTLPPKPALFNDEAWAASHSVTKLLELLGSVEKAGSKDTSVASKATVGLILLHLQHKLCCICLTVAAPAIQFQAPQAHSLMHCFTAYDSPYTVTCSSPHEHAKQPDLGCTITSAHVAQPHACTHQQCRTSSRAFWCLRRRHCGCGSCWEPAANPEKRLSRPKRLR